MACGGGGDSAPPPAAIPTPNIYLAQSQVAFAGIVLDNSADRILEIKNTGSANLKIGQIIPPAIPFSIYSDTCSSATLSPYQTCSLGIRFSPTDQGSFVANVSIPSNDPDSSAVTMSLRGDGYGLNVWINSVDTSSCPSVKANVTVTDPRSSALLNLLTKDNFKLYQNGQLQSIAASAIQYPSPVSLVLALDSSGSTVSTMPQIKAAASVFINELTDGDYAAICKFYATIEFSPLASPLFIAGDAAGKAALNAYIDSSFSGSGTALFEAVVQSVDRAALGSTNKRAVIVLSDGVDTTSSRTLDQVIAYANQKAIPVFTVFYLDPTLLGGQYGSRENMQRLAAETGGQYYSADSAALTAIFQQIANVLSSQYIITYTSPSCSGTTTVNVRADWNGLYGEDSGTNRVP